MMAFLTKEESEASIKFFPKLFKLRQKQSIDFKAQIELDYKLINNLKDLIKLKDSTKDIFAFLDEKYGF